MNIEIITGSPEAWATILVRQVPVEITGTVDVRPIPDTDIAVKFGIETGVDREIATEKDGFSA